MDIDFQQFATEMRQAIKNPDDRRAVAEKITKSIKDSIDQRDLVSLIMNKERVELGTKVEYTLDSKLKAYWHEPGSYAPRTGMYQKVFTVPTWMVSAHPAYELNQLEAGRYGTAQDQIVAARDAILGAINARVWSTLSGAISSSDDNYATSAGGLTRASVENAINWVEDQVGGVAAIVGRRNLLYNVLGYNVDTSAGDVGLYSDDMKDQIMKTGRIGTYYGVPLVGLPQWRDGYGKLTIPQDEVLVVGRDMGKYVVSRDMRSLDDIDIDSLTWHIHIWMMVGLAVFFPERMYKIKIT